MKIAIIHENSRCLFLFINLFLFVFSLKFYKQLEVREGVQNAMFNWYSFAKMFFSHSRKNILVIINEYRFRNKFILKIYAQAL